jgi:hypothetical protein
LSILNDPEFECEPWRREMMVSCFPLIDVRSRMINQNVRAQSQQLSKMAGSLAHDERYQRVKLRAQQLAMDWTGPHYGMPDEESQMFRRALGLPVRE